MPEPAVASLRDHSCVFDLADGRRFRCSSPAGELVAVSSPAEALIALYSDAKAARLAPSIVWIHSVPSTRAAVLACTAT